MLRIQHIDNSFYTTLIDSNVLINSQKNKYFLGLLHICYGNVLKVDDNSEFFYLTQNQTEIMFKYAQENTPIPTGKLTKEQRRNQKKEQKQC